jgi:hypothetical protein
MRKTKQLREDKETYHWERAPKAAKSFLVCAFHQQHFKPSNLKKSWTKEEPLTWELYRALELLPRRCFLLPFLNAVAGASAAATSVVEELVRDLDQLRLSAFPSMGLGGNKRNRRADLGVGFLNDPRLWIEVKTRRFAPEELRQQLIDEEQALRRLTDGGLVAVVALVPESFRTKVRKSLSWKTVHTLFQRGVVRLSTADVPKDVLRGHFICAEELVGRIGSHVPELVT